MLLQLCLADLSFLNHRPAGRFGFVKALDDKLVFGHQHGDQVHVTYSITGTNTGDLDLSQVGMPVIPATGKSIQLEQDEAMVEFDGDKISALKIKQNPNTGISGTLAQLGVEMPAA